MRSKSKQLSTSDMPFADLDDSHAILHLQSNMICLQGGDRVGVSGLSANSSCGDYWYALANKVTLGSGGEVLLLDLDLGGS